jgi:hypothetical protein
MILSLETCGDSFECVWKRPCEVPYCSQRRVWDTKFPIHMRSECPIMQTVIDMCGVQIHNSPSLTVGIVCLACQCGVGMFEEGYRRVGCKHCLQICYCPQRTFDEVGGVMDKDGVRLMKVSDMEKIQGTQYVTMKKEEVLTNASELRALMQKLKVSQLE